METNDNGKRPADDPRGGDEAQVPQQRDTTTVIRRSRRNLIQEIKNAGKEKPDVPDDVKTWYDLLVAKIPPHFASDKDFLMEIINNTQVDGGSALCFASEGMRDDFDLVELAVSCCHCNDHRRRDNGEDDNLLELLMSGRLEKMEPIFFRDSDSCAFEYASERLKGDRAIAGKAVSICNWPLMQISSLLKDDRGIVLKAIDAWRLSQGAHCLNYAWFFARLISPRLQNDKEVFLSAMAKISPWDTDKMLKNASPELQADRQVVLTAIRRDVPKSFEFASNSLKEDRDFVLEAVDVDYRCLEYASPSLRDDPSIIGRAIRSPRHYWHNFLSFISDNMGQNLRQSLQLALDCIERHLALPPRHFGRRIPPQEDLKRLSKSLQQKCMVQACALKHATIAGLSPSTGATTSTEPLSLSFDIQQLVLQYAGCLTDHSHASAVKHCIPVFVSLRDGGFSFRDARRILS